MCNCAI